MLASRLHWAKRCSSTDAVTRVVTQWSLVVALVLCPGCDQVFGLDREPAQLAPPLTLTGARWQAPCDPPGSGQFCFCKDATQQVALLGAADELYLVEVRIRGVYEDLHYDGGSAAHDGWLVGGSTADEQSNQLTIDVSAPAATYQINNSIDPALVDLRAHDYNASFYVRGDAVVAFSYGAGTGGQERRLDENMGMISLPGVSWFDGQYAELLVQAATLQ